MDASHSELDLHSTGKGEGETVGIALLGFGTVGAEVFRLLDENADAFAHRIGGPAEIRGIAVQNKNKLRPGVQVIARSRLDRNVTTLHRAGAEVTVVEKSRAPRPEGCSSAPASWPNRPCPRSWVPQRSRTWPG